MSSDPNAQPLPPAEFALAEEEARRRREQVIALFRGRLHWAVLLALILGSAGAVVGYFSETPEYMGQGVIKVEAELDGPMIDRDTRDVPRMFGAFLERQAAAMTSSEVAKRAIASDLWRQTVSEAGIEPLTTGDFKDALGAEIPRNSTNIFLLFTHDDPVVAAAGANATLRAYQDFFRQQEAERTDRNIGELNTTIAQLKAEELSLINQINQRLKTDETIFRERLAALNDQLIARQEDLNDTEAAIASIRRAADSTTPGLEEFQDPTAMEYDEQIAEREASVDTYLAQGYGQNHRDVRNLRAEIKTLQALKQKYLEQVRSGDTPTFGNSQLMQLMAAAQKLKEQVDDLDREIESKDQMLNSISEFASQLGTVRDRTARAEDEKFRTIQNGKALRERVQIEAYAVEPDEPSNASKRAKLAAVGLVGGGGFGVALVVLVGLLDSRLRHAADAKNGMRDVRMLGVLPSLPDDLADPDQAERAAHAVNHIRTLLQISGPNTRVFSITGPAAGSGKSSLTVALGLSFSASGNKVLLIDGDIVGAGLTRRLGAVVNRPFDEVVKEDGRVSVEHLNEAESVAIRKGINLMDALIEIGALSRDEAEKLARRRSDASLGILDACNGADLEECVAETGIPRLHVLPVGNARPEDAGLLSPKTLRGMLSAAREAYDIVLVDTGPVLGSLEASMAGAEADGTVLIVSRGDSKGVASRSLEHLQSVGARVVGIVFNHALEADLGETSYGSMVSQDRRGQASIQVDPAAAARFGPLGSAVATYGPAAALRNSPQRGGNRELVGASSNGHAA